jgi:HflK protein
VRTVEIGYRNSPSNRNAKEATMLTEDENIIDIQFAVQYDLVSAEAFVFNNRKPEEMVKFVAESAIREVVGRAKMDFALYEGREQIATQTREQMQKLMDLYRTGVNVQKVTLQSVQPPEKVQAAFDDAVKAQQDRVRSSTRARPYANDVVPRARGLASRLLEEANGYNTEVTQRAEGDASRFRSVLTEYAKAPGVTRDRLYLDMMQSVLGNTSKVHRRPEGSGNLLYMPLDKLMQQGRRGAARTRRNRRAAAPPAPTAPQPSRLARATACAAASDRLAAHRRTDTMRITMPLLALVVALILVASQALYTVSQTQYAIKFQLGEIVDVNKDAGLTSRSRWCRTCATSTAATSCSRTPTSTASSRPRRRRSRSTSSCCGASPTCARTTSPCRATRTSRARACRRRCAATSPRSSTSRRCTRRSAAAASAS